MSDMPEGSAAGLAAYVLVESLIRTLGREGAITREAAASIYELAGEQLRKVDSDEAREALKLTSQRQQRLERLERR